MGVFLLLSKTTSFPSQKAAPSHPQLEMAEVMLILREIRSSYEARAGLACILPFCIQHTVRAQSACLSGRVRAEKSEASGSL